jgi:hypothetical protein
MFYGSVELANEKLCLYLGSNNITTREVELEMPYGGLLRHPINQEKRGLVAMMQRDADILYLWHKVILRDLCVLAKSFRCNWAGVFLCESRVFFEDYADLLAQNNVSDFEKSLSRFSIVDLFTVQGFT